MLSNIHFDNERGGSGRGGSGTGRKWTGRKWTARKEGKTDWIALEKQMPVKRFTFLFIFLPENKFVDVMDLDDVISFLRVPCDGMHLDKFMLNRFRVRTN